MKLKNLLKMVNSSNFQITVEFPYHELGEGYYTFKSFEVNYLSGAHGIECDTDVYMACDSIAYLPKEILEREVTYISAFENRVEISCYLKEQKAKSTKVKSI